MSEALSAAGLRFSAGGSTLIDDVTVSVSSGEFIAVIGPNGAGKSTLLRLLSGDASPDDGTVRIGDADPATADAAHLARLRSVLPQHRQADIPFTAYEVVAMGRHPHRRDPDNSAAIDGGAIALAMERTATAELSGRVFATLSGGEQALVSLARVLAQDAPVVLLDEPTAALDVAHEERVMHELTARASSGSAVLAVLHDLNTAARYATRIVAMAAGRIAAIGPPTEVLTDDLLSAIYGHPMRVVRHPLRDCPLVLVAD
jgi:iron complex transport system ATP-binding protein